MQMLFKGVYIVLIIKIIEKMRMSFKQIRVFTQATGILFYQPPSYSFKESHAAR